AGHRECAEGVAVGHVHAGNDHPDRHSPRRVSAVFAAGRVLEASLLGVAMVLFVVVAGQWVAASASWARVFTLSGVTLAFALIAYGFAASALPVWLLLAPRDYLSAFIKAGAIFSLAAGILIVRPH